MKNLKKPPSASPKKRILIVDDHPSTRLGLKELLNREPDLAVCGEAGDDRQAHALVNATRPDLVLTDLTMPGKGGMEFIREMRKLHPAVPLLVVSMHDEDVYAERVLQGGARGFIMKSEGGRSLMEAVRVVLRGDIYVSKKMSARLLNRIAGRKTNRGETATGALTDREFDVFQLMGQGLGTKEIGQRLHISGKTVETHRNNLKRKLNLPTRTDLTIYAVRWAASKQLI
jgi:DNA-binding NarL/FixJ family response regulator